MEKFKLTNIIMKHYMSHSLVKEKHVHTLLPKIRQIRTIDRTTIFQHELLFIILTRTYKNIMLRDLFPRHDFVHNF